MGNFYSSDLFTDIAIINPLKYKGRGRPRLTDYMSLREAQKQNNSLLNLLIEKRKKLHA